MAINWESILTTRPVTVREMVLAMQIKEMVDRGNTGSETVMNWMELLVCRTDGRLSMGALMDASPDDLNVGIAACGKAFQVAATIANLSKQFGAEDGKE